MNGRRLLQGIIWDRSRCSLYVCDVLRKGICGLSDSALQNSNSLIVKRCERRSSLDGAGECCYHLPRANLHSACIENFDQYAEGSQSWIPNLSDVQGSRRDQDDKDINSYKGNKKRTLQHARPVEDSEVSVVHHHKYLKAGKRVHLNNYKTLRNISSKYESLKGLENVTYENHDDTEGSWPRKRGVMAGPIYLGRNMNEECCRIEGNGSEELQEEKCLIVTDSQGRGGPTNQASRKGPDAKRMFQLLRIQKGVQLQKGDRDALAKIFRHFLNEDWPKDQAMREHNISAVFFPKVVSSFRQFLLARCTHSLKKYLLRLGPSAKCDSFLFDLVVEFSNREFAEEIARYKALVETADLTKPHTWFPAARVMKRRVVYHLGPTNSGKTYTALQKFKAAHSGVYCAPLRLLAMEVYDNVNADGVYCSLITGQDKREVPFANHVACTVEMVSTSQFWEVAILDEIQLVTDEYRGWAWTRAFLGLQADELHVCGDPSALQLVKSLCALTGDELQEHTYKRFEPLSVSELSLEGKYSQIKSGDCIVAFSRKEIFEIKRSVEFFTKTRCCVIYGALPPETRTHQARLFNDRDSGYDVLVATDAVGMGLNLSIRRIVFYGFHKFSGDGVTKVSASQVKQIAGRAGRRGTLYETGIATTFYSEDMPYLAECLEEPFVEARSAGLFPGLEQIELFASQQPGATFSKLLDHFAEICQVDGAFFLCRCDHLKKVASVIDKVQNLTVEDKLSFILAPVNSRDAKAVGALHRFAVSYSQKVPVHLSGGAPSGSANSVLQLLDLEARHHVLSLYLWLSYHFPEEYFPHRSQAEQMATDIALVMGESLAKANIKTDSSVPTLLMKKAFGRRRFTCRTSK